MTEGMFFAMVLGLVFPVAFILLMHGHWGSLLTEPHRNGNTTKMMHRKMGENMSDAGTSGIYCCMGAETENIHLASRLQRFINFVVDLLCAGIGGSIIVVLIGLFDVIGDKPVLILAFSYMAYYPPLEAVFGRTVGKFVTGTKAVNEDGTKISFEKALTRSLCRLIPLEPWSLIGWGSPPMGWHDRITKTKVISTRRAGCKSREKLGRSTQNQRRTKSGTF